MDSGAVAAHPALLCWREDDEWDVEVVGAQDPLVVDDTGALKVRLDLAEELGCVEAVPPRDRLEVLADRQRGGPGEGDVPACVALSDAERPEDAAACLDGRVLRQPPRRR